MSEDHLWRLLRPNGEAAVLVDHDVIVGRGKKAQLRIDEVHVSRKHARLWVEGGDLLVEDLGSSNGTYLNGELLDMPAALAPGDRLRFDETEFTVEVAPQPAEAAPAPPEPEPSDEPSELAATVIMNRPLVVRPDADDSSHDRHWTESARPIGAPERVRRRQEDDSRAVTAPTEDSFDLGADVFEGGEEPPEDG
jgi:hypothetical protein